MSKGDASLVLGIILASAALFLPVVLWLSRRMEKKTAFIVATATWAGIMLALLFVPQGVTTLAYVMAALAGFGVSSAHLLPRAMGADVLEVDEPASGTRHEGIYSGFVLVRKLSTGSVLAVIGPVLSWSDMSKEPQPRPRPRCERRPPGYPGRPVGAAEPRRPAAAAAPAPERPGAIDQCAPWSRPIADR